MARQDVQALLVDGHTVLPKPRVSRTVLPAESRPQRESFKNIYRRVNIVDTTSSALEFQQWINVPASILRCDAGIATPQNGRNQRRTPPALALAEVQSAEVQSVVSKLIGKSISRNGKMKLEIFCGSVILWLNSTGETAMLDM